MSVEKIIYLSTIIHSFEVLKKITDVSVIIYLVIAYGCYSIYSNRILIYSQYYEYKYNMFKYICDVPYSKWGYAGHMYSNDYLNLLWVLMKEKSNLLRQPISEKMVNYSDNIDFRDYKIPQLYESKQNIYNYNDKIKFSICRSTYDKGYHYIILLYIDKNEPIETITNFHKYSKEMHQKDVLNIDKLNVLEFIGLNPNSNSINYNEPVYMNYLLNTNKTFNKLFFPEKQSILKRINYFLNNKEKYTQIGRQYSLGIMLYGEPGTGKSSFIKALAKHTNRHIITIPLNRITTCVAFTKVITDKIYGVLSDTEKIFVFEDADCMTKILFKRKTGIENETKTCELDTNSKLVEDLKDAIIDTKDKDKNGIDTSIKMNDNLTLSHILNMIDGINEGDGRIIVMTSNHIDKFDDALMRAGRFDLKINLNYLSSQNIIEFINEYFDIKLKLCDYQDKLTNVKITGANLMSMCEQHIDNYIKIFDEIEKTNCAI